MKEIKIGVLGFGTVGAGVVSCLLANHELIAARSGVHPVLTRVADLDIETDRGVAVPPGLLTTDVNAVIDDPDIDVVVELIGGTGIARELAERVIQSGKSLVTANKALLAHHGESLFQQVKSAGVDLYYEASVAGGIPIIKTLREGLIANHIESVYGILNGTCNYILTRMEQEGLPFEQVLDEAQKLGYAEADPSLDIDAIDTAHKTSLIAALVSGSWFGMDHLFVEGIRNLDVQDIRNAAKAGYRIKVLGIIKLQNNAVQMRVHPTLIPADSLLANVNDVFNAVLVKGDIVGETMFYGRGAGRDATASAVVADIVDVGLNLRYGSQHRVPAFRAHQAYDQLLPMSDIVTRYYLRLTVADQPHTLARIAQLLGDVGISIASVYQEEIGESTLPIVMITHEAREADIRRALEQIQALDVVQAAPVLLRIEDL